jgi:hypothetical protein
LLEKRNPNRNTGHKMAFLGSLGRVDRKVLSENILEVTSFLRVITRIT